TQLGIDPHCESEIYYCGALSPGRHLYGGWFHCVGHVEAGADALQRADGETVGAFELEPLTDGFALGFTTQLGLVPPEFAGQPVVQVEFRAEVPWVTATREPA